LARIVAVLGGLALVCCSWWMVDQNSDEPDGEVSLSLVVLANGSSVPVVIYEGGDEGGGNGGVPSIEDAQRVVAAMGGTPCAGLPAIGHLLKPAPHWVEVVRADGTSACLLSGRWRMAELADGVDDTLSVSDLGGRLHVKYKSRAGNQERMRPAARAEPGERMRPAAPKTLAPPKPPAGPDPDSPWRPPS
jgi:hypothetical protein